MYVDESRNQLRYVQRIKDSPVNEGMLCVKGRIGFDFIQSEERLDTPLTRKDGKQQSARWDEAISLVADKIGEIKAEFDGNALAGFS